MEPSGSSVRNPSADDGRPLRVSSVREESLKTVSGAVKKYNYYFFLLGSYLHVTLLRR